MTKSFVGGLLGLAVGDAMGAGVEQTSREELKRNPVKGYLAKAESRWNQEPGCWTDDTSMALALACSLIHGIDYEDVMRRFEAWLYNGAYTPEGEAYSVGDTTKRAIEKFHLGTSALLCGDTQENNCGNGSLMRALPLAPVLFNRYGSGIANDEAMEIVHNMSRVTHGHLNCLMGCGIYLTVAVQLLAGAEKYTAVQKGTEAAFRYYEKITTVTQRRPFDRVWDPGTLAKMHEEEINSTGYVVDTLEAALWCLLTTDSFQECILKAVNLGEDTDTTAAVAGGLAGILYGRDSIPSDWLCVLKKREELEKVAIQLEIKS